jgi:hypothetical protein
MNRSKRYGLWMLSAAAFLLTLNAQTSNAVKLVGKWKLNTAKSQYQGPPPPSEGTLVVSQATASHFKWKATFGFTGNGRTRWDDYGFDGALDGRPYEYKGAPRGTHLSYVDIDGVLEGTSTSPDGTTQHETITVSADGNTMTSQSKLSFPKGTASWTEVWERVPDKKGK